MKEWEVHFILVYQSNNLINFDTKPWIMKKKVNNILLVDDDELTNFLHEKTLKKADVTDNILIALNGEAALDIIRKAFDDTKYSLLPELIFLDINMPKMNGWEFIEEFQKLEANIKRKVIIVMLTASSNSDDKIKAASFPEITAFISKPLTVEIVNELFQEHFNTNNL